MNKVIAIGLIVWGGIIASAALIWLDMSDPNVGRRFAAVALGVIMVGVGLVRLMSTNISRVGRPARRTRVMDADSDEAGENVGPRTTEGGDDELGVLRGAFPTQEGFPQKIAVYDFGFEFTDAHRSQKYRWYEIAVVQYWDGFDGVIMRIHPRTGEEIYIEGRTNKFGRELGGMSRNDVNELLTVLQGIADEPESPLEIRRTPFSIALDAEGRPVEAPFIIQSLGVISILFFWAPLIGLGLAIAAILMNRRLGGWGKITSWIGLVLSILVTITCLTVVGAGMIQGAMEGKK